MTHDHSDPNAPGGIPDELVDAALDGEVCDALHDEIVRALQYNRTQRERVAETLDAIDAMREVPAPDFQLSVLNTLDRRRVFMPGPLRRMVRTGRLGVAAALLVTLMVVSAIQSVSPRFATIAPHATPVEDVTRAIGSDGASATRVVEDGVRRVHAVVGPWAIILDPGVRDDAPRMTRAQYRPSLGESTPFVLFAGESSLLAPPEGGGAPDASIPALP